MLCGETAKEGSFAADRHQKGTTMDAHIPFSDRIRMMQGDHKLEDCPVRQVMQGIFGKWSTLLVAGTGRTALPLWRVAAPGA
jgi:hypothetical protein